MSAQRGTIVVRNTTPADFDPIIALTRQVYPQSKPWTQAQLQSHLRVFPEGQFVAVNADDGAVAGMAASLVVMWDDYAADASWRDFTASGTFENHDPVNGRTLYGAEIMVHPGYQSHGIGSKLYDARRALAIRLKLKRIRAGARLRGYGAHAATLTPEQYVIKVIHDELRDPTLSFQLHRGFDVLAVVSGYLTSDPESLGKAAVIEWLNPDVAKAEDAAGRDVRFKRPPSKE